ncbi:TetR/AcrR family transcriptional regulator [Sphingomonas sp. BK235]|uniref:TetR/AcrR family transcriptional regulator n=1 Tax=Sphingomonas sp. BK235 TaxID=2512131 RepID=UPI0010491BDA|nr:TetR/AcrR family transcriptional regulator [Sphingomonas sp. BK235]TCP30139.1 TetR family transcriptional regulator [Sphingomonas sp. BK235]
MPRTGRPREYDRDAALRAATHLFWEHGFDAVSLEQLLKAMGGLSKASFYAAFKSKEQLYRDAVAYYLVEHGRVSDDLANPALPPRKRLEVALRRTAAMQCDPSHPSGCLVGLSAMTAATGGLNALTADERARNRALIGQCVREALAIGELKPGVEPDGVAALLDGLLLGISIMARDGVPRDTINAAISSGFSDWRSDL